MDKIMLKELHIKNFKSYKNQTLKLAPLTVLIGDNGSGKSNAIEALKLLSWSVSNIGAFKLKKMVRGDLFSFFHPNTDLLRVGCKMDNIQQEDDIVEVILNNDSIRDYNVQQNQWTVNPESFAKLSQATKYALSKKITFLKSIPSVKDVDPYPLDIFQDNGANFLGVLYNKCQIEYNRLQILYFLQNVLGEQIKDIRLLQNEYGKFSLKLRERFLNQEIYTSDSDFSDGLVYILAIATALISMPENSMLVIEDFGNVVYPAKLKALLETIQKYAEKRNIQLLISTHNPVVMDFIPNNIVHDVVFCYKNSEFGDSCLVRLSDLSNYPELILQDKLGKLVTKGIVDRFIKEPISAEERKQKALDYLNSIR